VAAEPGWQWLPGGPDDWSGTTWSGTPDEHNELASGFARVAHWAGDRGLPVFVGEFGRTTRADPRSRAAWARANRLLAEQHGFSWGWWSFGPSFALYDLDSRQRDASILSALVDPGRGHRRAIADPARGRAGGGGPLPNRRAGRSGPARLARWATSLGNT